MNKLYLVVLSLVFGLVLAKAHPGIGIVQDQQGNIYYTDLTHVWKISPDGERSIAVRNVHTHELYIDENGDLYGEHEWYEGEATDKWGNYVWCLSKYGELEKTIPDVEGFLDNNTLVRDIRGSSYWAEKHDGYEMLRKQGPKGESQAFSSHQFTDIRWMHYSRHDQNLYVVDNLDVKQITPKGEVRVIADNLKEDKLPFGKVADRHYIFGLWTDREKQLYVALYGAGKVMKISEGVVSEVYESSLGWSPCGGLVAADGTLWIMEFSWRNKTRVKRISPSGQSTLFED